MAEFRTSDGRSIAVQVLKPLSNDSLKGYLECLKFLSPTTVDVERAKWLTKEKLNRGDTILVAFHENTVVGTATSVEERKVFHYGGWVAHIEDVVVHEKWRSLGIGEILVNELVRIAKENGAYKCVLTCNPELGGYYQKLGFHKSGLEMRLNL